MTTRRNKPESFTETLARGELSPLDFMMMDVHRPLTLVEIEEVCPEATVDHTEEPKRYNGPFVKYPENVEVLDVNTSHELAVERVLQSAHDNKLERVIVVGHTEDGELYVLCSDPDIGESNLLLDRAKADLLHAINNNGTREDPRGPKSRA